LRLRLTGASGSRGGTPPKLGWICVTATHHESDLTRMHDTLVGRERAEWLATTALTAFFVYLYLVTSWDVSLAGVVLQLLFAAAGLRLAIHQGVNRRLISPDTLLNISLLGGAFLASLLSADLAVSAYLNLVAPPVDLQSLASRDPHTFVEELYPRLYYPTVRNFRLHKPGLSITGSHYGDLYLPPMLRSRTLVDSVLDRRQVSIHINELGFRETSPLGTCRIFALGDSFTFGWGVTDGKTWPDVLEQRAGQCVYNLGVHDASPLQELLLLEYVLSRPEHPRPRHLVWAIYEGNDLEDSYEEESAEGTPGRLARATSGTIFDLESLEALVRRVQAQSILHRFRLGQLRLAPPNRRHERREHYEVDGVNLINPLFHAPQLGFMLVYSHELRRAAKPQEYLLHHSNRPRLDQVFARMARLSDSLGFSITVLIVPTSVRVYAPYFALKPAPSAEPHFVNYVEAQARKKGFGVVNLLEVFAPRAPTEFLYLRDDDHLNQRGHEVVATALAERFMTRGSQ